MSAHPGPGSISVLICDDNQAIRDVLRDVIGLRPSLNLVGVAADGNQAITQAQQLQPDVILLDLAMPHRTGLSALPELLQVAPQTRIIVLSSLAKTSINDTVTELGAALYLEKGASPDQINDAIEAVTTTTKTPPRQPAIAFATGVEENTARS
jgi:DNA-binding NarL/FixJ family response regulator